MKKIYQIIYIAILLLAKPALAQVPQGMNYQAIARDASGSILPAKNISIRISITNGNAGPLLYRETHSPTTNQFGLFTLNVGNGTPDTATFSSIDWANVTPWMSVEMDPNGNSNYTPMGTSQLLSVPYAMYAGSTGQSTQSVFGIAGLTITSTDTTLIIIPGLVESVNVPANSKVLISSTGAVETSANTAAGFSVVDILIYVDGGYAGPGCYKRVIAANSTGLVGMISNWSLTSSVSLSPGNHTIDARVLYTQGSTAYVSGNGSSVLQGSLTATVIKN